MFVIIAGGGRTGSQLALVLLSGEHQVLVVEHRREMLTRLHQELPTEAIYEGNANRPGRFGACRHSKGKCDCSLYVG